MKAKSAQDCIHRILTDIEKRRTVNYADRNSVRRYNAAMDRIKDNAQILWDNYPDQRDMLINLIYSTDYYIASHCAHIVYGMKDSTREQKKLVLARVKELIHHPDAPELSKYGMLINIERWEAELAEKS